MRTRVAKHVAALALALVVGVAGCASGGGGSGGGGGSPNRLTADDLQPVVQLNAYQAIQRLRGRWLQARGGMYATVFVDGTQRFGGLEALRSIMTADVEEMRYLSSSDATTRYGTGHEGGAILLTTKR